MVALKRLIQEPSGCLSDGLRRLDFSHLQAKGLEIRSSRQCASSADQGAYPPPTDHNDAVYGPFTPLFSENASSTTSRFLISSATFCGSVCRNDPQKVPRAFVESLSDAVC